MVRRLMGAVGLNGAAKGHSDSWRDNAQIASTGWSKWTPVNAVAIGAHLIGSSGLLAANTARVATQQGVAASTLAKTVLTGAALAATAYARKMGKKIELASSKDPLDTEADSSIDTREAERHLSYAQWLIPAITGGLLILNHGPPLPGPDFARRVRELLAAAANRPAVSDTLPPATYPETETSTKSQTTEHSEGHHGGVGA